MAGCFKLNPEFVEDGSTSEETGPTGQTGDPSDTGPPDVSRITEGLQVLYVFDDAACEMAGTVTAREGPDLRLEVPSCAQCGAEGLRVRLDYDPMVQMCDELGIEPSAPIEVGPGVGFTVELWVTTPTGDDGVVLDFGTNLELHVDPGRFINLRHRTGDCSVALTERADGATAQHVAATYAEGTLRLYANESANQCMVSITPEDLDPLRIGFDSSRRWDGAIELLAIYDRPLDYAEYAQNNSIGPWPPGSP